MTVALIAYLGMMEDIVTVENVERLSEVSCSDPEHINTAACHRVDAIVLILCGDLYARTTLPDRTLQSIHDHIFPKFPNIALFVMTNRLDCFEGANLYHHPRVHMIRVDINGDENEAVYMRPMHYKATKTRVFEFLPKTLPGTDKPLNHVLYIDSDIILTKLAPYFVQNLPDIYDIDRLYKSEPPTVGGLSPIDSLLDSSGVGGRLRRRLGILDSDPIANPSALSTTTTTTTTIAAASTVTKKKKKHHCTLGMMPERLLVKNNWQSGIMYLDRESSSKCLEKWLIQIESRKYTFDQDAYDHTPECQERCAIGKVDDVAYMRDAKEVFLNSFKGILSSSLPENRAAFMHFTGPTHRQTTPCEQYGTWNTDCMLYKLSPTSFAANFIKSRTCKYIPFGAPIPPYTPPSSFPETAQRRTLRWW